MAEIRPFRGVRPVPELASRIAALPYDVYTSAEARRIVEENPDSFLKIDRAETQFPEGTDMYSPEVYVRARETLAAMQRSGELVQEEKNCYYIYTQTREGRRQTGVVCTVSIDDYLRGVVKKHENTREDKLRDRICHVDACSAHTGPVFLACRGGQELRAAAEEAMQGEILYDFYGENGVRHQVWRVEEGSAEMARMTRLLAQIDRLYIADGHHRAASAVQVGQMRRKASPSYDGTEEFNYFLAVIFPAEELRIYDYNRVVQMPEGVPAEELIRRLESCFAVEPGKGRVKPEKKGEIGIYLEGRWLRLTARPEICPADPVEGLDVSILQRTVLEPLFGIEDPKSDPRIRFVGGVRGLAELERIADREKAAAFAMYPPTMEELIRVADAGRQMPPKSTWFEPKLLSGLLIHRF